MPAPAELTSARNRSRRLRDGFLLRGKFVIHRLVFVAKPELDSVLLYLQVNFAFSLPDRVQRPAFECLRVITPNLDVAGYRFKESGRAALGFKVLERGAQS